MLRRILATTASIVVVGGLSMGTAGAGGNYGGCSASVSDTTPAPGQTITVTGSGAADSGDVSATLDGTEIGSGTADAQGDFTFDATIPSTASGSETLSVSCGAGRGVMPLTLSVSGSSTSGGLPTTGSDSDVMTLVGISAIGLGSAAVVLAARRARASAKHLV